MRFPEILFRLPEWVEGILPDPNHTFPTVTDRMRFVITLSRLNVEHATGGPFGAGIFDKNTNRLLAPGINIVTQSNCSVAHAEIMAIMIAQNMIGHYDLGYEGLRSFELVTSTEPCAMCLGAVCWSGIRLLVCGAREVDARNIGFDEGPKISNWTRSLKDRGIIVLQDICRYEASAVLNQYLKSGGIIYNSRQGNVK